MSFLRCFTIVREKSVCIVERFGRYHQTLEPGFHFMVPVMDRIAYRKSLKEETISLTEQHAITKDNVTVSIDGTLFVQVLDPFKASYKVERPFEAIKQLGITIVRSEIGKMRLDRLFQERAELNKAINNTVNEACEDWGLACLRYEILNIEPPQEIKISMQYEAEAERLKRREILISEGRQQAQINISQGLKNSIIKKAEGLAESVQILSEKEAQALSNIAESLNNLENRDDVIKYMLTQNYLKGYKKTIKKANLVLTPQGQKGAVGKNSNDLVNMAAMMLLQKSGATGRFDSRYIEEQIQNIQQQQQNQNNVQEQELSQANFLNKMQYFDDPLLYGEGNYFQKEKSTEQFSEDEKDELYYEGYSVQENNQQNINSNSGTNRSSYLQNSGNKTNNENNKLYENSNNNQSQKNNNY